MSTASDFPPITILCGGRGSRLGAATAELPKPLVPFGKRNILEIKLEHYIAQGFRRFIFAIGYKGERIREAVSGFMDRAEIHFSDAGEQAGMLARIWHAREFFGDTTVLSYGDTFADMNLHELLQRHSALGSDATIVTAPIVNPFGLVEFGDDGIVQSFREKPVLKYFIGYTVLTRRAFEALTHDAVNLPDGAGLVALFDALIARQRLGVHYHEGLEISFNTHEERRAAEARYLKFYTRSGGAS